MWFLITTSGERKDFGGTIQRECENCRSSVVFRLLLTRLWVGLFFIPIFVWRDAWRLECPVCEKCEELHGEELTAAKELNRARTRNHKQCRVF
jgi:hypothetical protein